MMVIFIVWVVFILIEQKTIELHKKIYENKHSCGVVMPSEDNKILEFKQYWKSDKTAPIFYADLESLKTRWL